MITSSWFRTPAASPLQRKGKQVAGGFFTEEVMRKNTAEIW